MPSEPRWLTPGEVIYLNERVVAETGEPFGVLSESLLESGLERPRSLWLYEEERDAVTLAVRLLFGIAGNHPFLEGNKRTGFEAALIFLLANGYTFDGPDHEALAWMVIEVITRETTELQFEEAIRPYVVALPTELE